MQKQVMCVYRAASWEIHVTSPEKPFSRSVVIPVVRSSPAMEGDSLEAVTVHRADGLSLAVAIVLREDVRKVDALNSEVDALNSEVDALNSEVDALNSEVDDRADSEVVRQAVWTVNQS